MFGIILQNLRHCWAKLLVADLIFKAISFILLAPAVSLVFRGFLLAYGSDVLADADIAKFLLHPIGIAALLIVSALLVGLFAIELAILMTLSLAAQENRTVSIRGAMHFIATRSVGGIVRLALRIIFEMVLWAIPFLATGGGFFWLFLTDHDINFYLTDKPPEFWTAVACIGACLFAMAAVLLWRISNYVFATQILIFEKASPREALEFSTARAIGHRLVIIKALCVWGAIHFCIGVLLTFAVGFVGQTMILAASGTIIGLAFAVGAALSLVVVANVLATGFSNSTLGCLLGIAYYRFGRDESGEVHLPTLELREIVAGIRVTPGRVVTTLIVGVLAAGLLGRFVLSSFNLEDNVVITAHRGGASVAPENTLAAMERAIVDKTDWIEIDVQESSDGVVVVAHDSDLKKVAGNATKIWEATADQLRQIDIGSYHSAEFSSERMPTLDETLKLCKGRMKLNIELKYYGHTQDLEAKVVGLVEANEMQDDIVIMSLKQAGLDKIKKLRPEWTCGLLTAVATGDLTKANADFLAVNASIASKSFIQLAHKRDKEVAAWTLNTATDISRMISRGVDNIITDDVALVHSVLEQRRDMSPVDRILLELAVYFGAETKAFEQ